MGTPNFVRIPRRTHICLAVLLAVGAAPSPGIAAVTDISNVPLTTATGVKPNLMYILDDSGSMMMDGIPDYAAFGLGGPAAAASSAFNFLYYNPATTYRPGSNADGTSMGVQGSPWTAVRRDGYSVGPGTVNLVSGTDANFWEWFFCNSSVTPRVCRRNGIDNLYGGTTFAFETPPGPTFTGVAFARAGNTVTGQTAAAHGFAVGDTITVTGAGGCSAPVALVTTVPSTTSFTFDYGSTFTPACVAGSVRRAVTGYPETSQKFDPGFTFTAPGRAGLTVTVTRAGHSFIVGDVINVLGNWPCNVGDTPITAVTATTFSYSTFLTGACSGTYTVLQRPVFVRTSALAKVGTTVTVTHANHFMVVNDIITVYGGGAPCNVTNVRITAVTAGTFSYPTTSAAACTGTYSISRTLYGTQINLPAASPFYFEILPTEHCRDEMLMECVASTVPVGAFTFPAPVRFCRSQALATTAAPVSTVVAGDTIPAVRDCQAMYADTTPSFASARLGLFRRVNILSTTPTYGGSVRDNRFDCAARPVCTYAEEMTNYANWYTYYRTRMNQIKTVSGIVLAGMTDTIRIGFITINPTIWPSTNVSATRYLAISDFNTTQKTAFFNMLYAQAPTGGTPLPEALSRVGRHYAGRTDGINAGMTGDPIQHACQRNYALLTTDGYWGGTGGNQIDGTVNVGNWDNSETATAPGDVENRVGPRGTRAGGRFDGNCGANCSNTLADVAMYYWANDLRPTMANTVRTSPENPAYWQNMTTFTLGMANGLMRWKPDYDTSSTGDFANIKAGAMNRCSWVTGTCNWPNISNGFSSRLDDLWQAAVNGRGKFYQAMDAKSITDGLGDVLLQINAEEGSASASATTSNIVGPGADVLYSAGYKTDAWTGKLDALKINVSTGLVDPVPVWSTNTTLDLQVGPTSDTRTIYTFDGSNTITRLKSFTWSALTAAEQTLFSNACIPATKMTQCATLNAGDLTAANDGATLVNFLRGQRQQENKAFRKRENVQGDAVNAEPVYVGAPTKNFTDSVTPAYADFKTANAARTPVIYVAANDGMLHAFDARVPGSNGQELWAYVPRMLLEHLPKLADSQYRVKHRFYVDGTPTVADVYVDGAWRTVLVGGLNSGGRGYYALDITDPANPKALWEFCHDSAVCSQSDQNLGLTYGYPVITKRASDGKWVVLVTSGYNNVSPGDGKGRLFVLDLETGAKLTTIDTGEGSTTDPSGLGRISGWNDDPLTDNTTRWVYGADLKGNVWRFDLSTTSGSVLKLAELRSGTDVAQRVTTRPELASIEGKRVLFVGSGSLLGTSDLTSTAIESFYAFKDVPDNATTGYGTTLRTALVQQTFSQSGGTRTISSNAVNWNTGSGWFFDFLTAGERVNVDPKTYVDAQIAQGRLLVAANIPGTDVCAAGGSSWFYVLDYTTGSYASDMTANASAYFNAGAMIAGFTVVKLAATGDVKAIVKSTKGDHTTTSVMSVTENFRRATWRMIGN
ncbi:MAG: pilus assembly protein [Betaproteobacteria bacterium]